MTWDSKKSEEGFLYTPWIISRPPSTPMGFVPSRTTTESVKVSKYCTNIPVTTLTLAFFLTFTHGVDVDELCKRSPNERVEISELDSDKIKDFSIFPTYLKRCAKNQL